MTAAQNKFLRIYYARVKECSRHWTILRRRSKSHHKYCSSVNASFSGLYWLTHFASQILWEIFLFQGLTFYLQTLLKHRCSFAAFSKLDITRSHFLFA
jgi:hypothetical protein